MIKKETKEKGIIQGKITLRSHPSGTADRIYKLQTPGFFLSLLRNFGFQWAQKRIISNFRHARKIILSGKIESVTQNLIMQGASTGKDLLVQRLIGDTTYTTIINYGAIGTGNTTPSQSDTQLVAESARTIVADAIVVGNNEAEIQFFLSDGILANGTYKEFGTFIDGTSSPNTGQIFNRALFASPYTKVSGTDTTVEVDITFT